MSTIRIKPEEFDDFIVAYLLDKVMDKEDRMTGSEEFEEIIKKMKLAGFEPFLLRHFIRSPVVLRTKYKIAKDIFDKNGKIDKIVVNIQRDTNKKKDTSSIVAKIKKALKMIKDAKVKSNRPYLTEAQVDKIIDRVLEDEQE